MIRMSPQFLSRFILFSTLLTALLGFYLGSFSVETLVSEGDEVLVFEFETSLFE